MKAKNKQADEAPEELNDLLESPVIKDPEEAKYKTRKQVEREELEEMKSRKEKASGPKVEPTDDFIRDKKGKIKIDADGDQERHPAGFLENIGYVTESGVLFPCFYKFKGGHVGTFGNVILVSCPECKHYQSVDESREGVCARCGFSQIKELEEYVLKK